MNIFQYHSLMVLTIYIAVVFRKLNTDGTVCLYTYTDSLVIPAKEERNCLAELHVFFKKVEVKRTSDGF